MNSDQKNWQIVFLCWLIATVATAGSLFFSEVMEYLPCVLCWYQRIAMYPLVIIFLVPLLTRDKSFFYYSFPLTCVGWVTALYHNLLHYGIIPEEAAPCVQGVSCTIVYIELLGFITIPIMSFVAFGLIGGLLLYQRRKFAI